jgi:ABC-type uncharacterized transport system YnjBCD ATPase subunit
MTSHSQHPRRRQLLAEAPGALVRGDANLAQIRKVLRAYGSLQKAELTRELLGMVMEQFPAAFDGHARAEVAHIRQLLANLHPGDAREFQ